jgi:hypothetical protein
MKLGALTLVDNCFFLWYISLFISVECPSLPHLINVSLKSTLSKISIAIPACFAGAIGLVNLPPAFPPQSVLFSVN